jgi:hypothetical protein
MMVPGGTKKLEPSSMKNCQGKLAFASGLSASNAALAETLRSVVCGSAGALAPPPPQPANTSAALRDVSLNTNCLQITMVRPAFVKIKSRFKPELHHLKVSKGKQN